MEAEAQEGRSASGTTAAAGVQSLAVLVAARNEADRIGDTVTALREAFPGARVIVADDASTDGTAAVAMANGAEVVRGKRSIGKGGNMNRAAEVLMQGGALPLCVLVCDGDLGASAAELVPLTEAVAAGECDLAIAAFRRRVGGGFGIALRFARWAIRRRCGYEAGAPISGQRALSAEAFRAVLPFAHGYGMEIGMTVAAVRAGLAVRELELSLEHRATGRSVSGFVHRGRQLRDFMRVYLRTRGG